MNRQLIATPIALTLKNCFRCGREFRVARTARLCPSCRKPRTRPGGFPRTSELTFREKQVIELVRRAMLNKEIAHELHLTEGTVKEYLNRIFRKLAVKNRTELAIWAMTRSGGMVWKEAPPDKIPA